MQAGVNAHTCLACGALTEDATGQLLPKVAVPASVSNFGHPVRELSSSPTPAPGSAQGRVDASAVAHWAKVSAGPDVIPDVMGPGAHEPDVPEDTDVVDLAQLSVEQAQAIERILHPET